MSQFIPAVSSPRRRFALRRRASDPGMVEAESRNGGANAPRPIPGAAQGKSQHDAPTRRISQTLRNSPSTFKASHFLKIIFPRPHPSPTRLFYQDGYFFRLAVPPGVAQPPTACVPAIRCFAAGWRHHHAAGQAIRFRAAARRITLPKKSRPATQDCLALPRLPH